VVSEVGTVAIRADQLKQAIHERYGH
jgi:hypothetical protein